MNIFERKIPLILESILMAVQSVTSIFRSSLSYDENVAKNALSSERLDPIFSQILNSWKVWLWILWKFLNMYQAFYKVTCQILNRSMVWLWVLFNISINCWAWFKVFSQNSWMVWVRFFCQISIIQISSLSLQFLLTNDENLTTY